MDFTFLGIIYSLLSWFVFSIILFFLFMILGHFYIPLKEKLKVKEIYSLFVFSWIISFIFFIVLYIVPLFMGITPDIVGAYNVWYMYVYAVFIIILKLILYSLLFAIITQPLILLGLFLYDKFLTKNSELVSKFFVSMILSFLVLLISYLFPWIIGGFIAMLFF